MESAVLSPATGPHSAWGRLQQEYYAHVREVAKDELFYLKRAGARGQTYRKLVVTAQTAESAHIFNRIADYAERVMPVLQANRANWPSSYQVSDLIETTPGHLRHLADTTLSDFLTFKRQHPDAPYPRCGLSPPPKLHD